MPFHNHTYSAYTSSFDVVFVELPAFEVQRARYLDDEGFRILQLQLIRHPDHGDVIQGSGGLRKLRFADKRRGKGKRGGLRIIYYWWESGLEFWLFTVFDKDEMSDLGQRERAAMKAMLKAEIEARRH